MHGAAVRFSVLGLVIGITFTLTSLAAALAERGSQAPAVGVRLNSHLSADYSYDARPLKLGTLDPRIVDSINSDDGQPAEPDAWPATPWRELNPPGSFVSPSNPVGDDPHGQGGPAVAPEDPGVAGNIAPAAPTLPPEIGRA